MFNNFIDFKYSGIRSGLSDMLYWINVIIGCHPNIYYKIYARKPPYNDFAVNSSTGICIEGYPRCANSYAVYAFKNANKDIKIGHHLHVPAQIKQSTDYKIPTILDMPEIY